MAESNNLQEASTSALSIHDFEESNFEILRALSLIPSFNTRYKLTKNQSDNTKSEPVNIPDASSLVKIEEDSGKQDDESTISPTTEKPTTSVPNAQKSHKYANVNKRKQNIQEGILTDAQAHFAKSRLRPSATGDKNKNNKKSASSKIVEIKSNAQKETSKCACSTKEPKQEQKLSSDVDSYPQNTTEEKLSNTSMLCKINSNGTVVDSAMIIKEDKNVEVNVNDKENSLQIGSTQPDFQMKFNLQDENATSTAVESDVDFSFNFKRPYFCHECREVSNIDDHEDSTLDSDECDGAKCLMKKIDISDLIVINDDDICKYLYTPPEDDIDKIVVELMKAEDEDYQSKQNDLDKVLCGLIVEMEGTDYPVPSHETMIEEVLSLEENVKQRLQISQKSLKNAD